MPATKFTITGAGAQVAGAFQTITITADDVGYVGDHAITFSGAADPAFGNPGHPQTTDKNAVPVAFGAPCTLTFALGVATTDMTLLKAEAVNIACTDGTISAAGADRLAVTVSAGPAQYFDWNTSGASQIAGAVFQILTINAVDPWGNIDTTYHFPAGKNLTFSGIGLAPDTTPPTVSNNAAAPIAFGAATAINFTNGVAVSDATQLDVKLYLAGLAQVIAFTDGTVTSLANETVGFLVPKAVDVVAAVIDHFVVALTSGQVSTGPFTGTNSITAQDAYDNPKLTFDASADSVTIVEDAPLAGAITGLGSGNNDTLDQAGDFVNGVANLTAAMIYTGIAGNSTFTVTSNVTAKTGTSNAIGISSKFVVTGGAAEVAGVVNPITITADDASYTGDHTLTFSGANLALFPGTPNTKDKNAVVRNFGVSCVLTFAAGVATTDMTLYKTEVVDIAVTDGFIVAAGADRLNVTVSAGTYTFFDWNTDNGPTVVAGVQFNILEIDAFDNYGNFDLTYTGDHNITFSNIAAAPDGTLPTVTDKTGAAVNFGVATTITFLNGQAVPGVNQLKTTFYKAALTQLIHFTDGTKSNAFNESAPFLSPKEVDVLAAALDHFAFVLGPSQEYGVPFIGTNTLTAQDQFDNPIILFDASADNVQVAATAPPLIGVVSGLGSGANDTLDQAGDFVLGVATLTGLMIFTGAGDGTFTATSVSAKTGVSNAVGFNLASQGNPIWIDSVMALSYQNGGSAPNNLQIYPRAIKWDSPGAAGHQVVITDINGQILFQHTAQAQYKGCYVLLNRNSGGGGRSVRWKDFIVSVIDSGDLYIWYTT